MSTKPTLQIPDDILEEPDIPETQRGLVSRKSVLVFVVILVLMLAAFAYYDLTQTPPKPVDKAQAFGGQATQIAAVGPAPQAADVQAIAAGQSAKSGGVSPEPQQQNSPVPGAGSIGTNGSPRAPEDARVSPRVGSPVDFSNRTATAAAAKPDAQAARAERDGAAAESSIFANGVSGSNEPMSSAVEAATGNLADPLARQIEEAKRALTRTAAPAADPTADIIRAMSAAQPTQSQVRQGRDEAWLTGQAATTTAEAVYAKTPASRFMIFQGTRVPLVTREAINSDLPGQVTAMSTANVYDSINQCAVMVPAGTKFIGAYSSDIRPGQSRLLLSYRRMIFPDGRSVDLDGAQGVDQKGSSGADADVNNHFLQMFGYGFAMAIIGDRVGGQTNVSVRNTDGSTSTTSIAGQVFGDIANRVLSRNAVIPPTLSLPPGTPMFVTIVRDIALTPTSWKNCK